MKLWKKIVFVVVLVSFITLSVFFTFYSISRDTFEFEEQTNIADITDFDGWVFFGFNGNASTKEISIDYVRDEKGNNPDKTKPVVAVDEFTVVSDEYVEIINIGKDVRHIEERAFYYCKMLKAVNVDPENENYCSVDGVLYTKDMKTLVLRPIKNGDWLVEQKLADTNDTFDVPEGVTRIAACAFYKNDELIHLTLPSSLEEIGDMGFFGCYNMWTVWLNEGLKTIGNDAFSNDWCMSPMLYIPASVEKIGNNAFFNCSGINTIYLGAESEASVELGQSWRPKSLGGALKRAPEPQYGKTLKDAETEKARLDGENS